MKRHLREWHQSELKRQAEGHDLALNTAHRQGLARLRTLLDQILTITGDGSALSITHARTGDGALILITAERSKDGNRRRAQQGCAVEIGRDEMAGLNTVQTGLVRAIDRIHDDAKREAYYRRPL